MVGRDCTFRLIASGEDDLGNSIGSTIHSFDITLTGGFAGVGGVVDNSLKVNSGSNDVFVSNDLLEVGCAGSVKATLALTTDGTLSISSSVSGVTLTPAFGTNLDNLTSGDRFTISITADGTTQAYEVEVRYILASGAN